ncbi:MAG: hypothetical protein O3B01_25920 [Planctomycetota bacterium]|nr:hypothetical protein [Planctomycetota bacterium]MDA1142014.1 hypothetical protein [Planctomycetota bacterium]
MPVWRESTASVHLCAEAMAVVVVQLQREAKLAAESWLDAEL